MFSAQAWADAGWPPAKALTEPRLSDYWNPPLKERVRMTDVLSLAEVKAFRPTEPNERAE